MQPPFLLHGWQGDRGAGLNVKLSYYFRYLRVDPLA